MLFPFVEPNSFHELKDGPLEKLSGGGGGGGKGEFSSLWNFFIYQIPCMNFF